MHGDMKPKKKKKKDGKKQTMEGAARQKDY